MGPPDPLPPGWIEFWESGYPPKWGLPPYFPARGAGNFFDLKMASQKWVPRAPPRGPQEWVGGWVRPPPPGLKKSSEQDTIAEEARRQLAFFSAVVARMLARLLFPEQRRTGSSKKWREGEV